MKNLAFQNVQQNSYVYPVSVETLVSNFFRLFVPLPLLQSGKRRKKVKKCRSTIQLLWENIKSKF